MHKSFLVSLVLIFSISGVRAIAADDSGFEVAYPSKKAIISLISLAPSPYTNTHDSMRAGYGIFYFLHKLTQEHTLPLSAKYYDGALALGDVVALEAMTNNHDVLIIGASVWSQGSTRYTRQFFEDIGAGDWLGKSVSAWATAGGQHTGGSVLVADTLRSAMGLGARVFSLGQKYMVFSTDERIGITDHHFTLLDMWFMQQFACAIAVEALTHIAYKTAEENTSTLGCYPHYYTRIPKAAGGLDEFAPFADFLNRASNPASEEWRSVRAHISNHPSEQCDDNCASAATHLQPFSATH